CPGPVLRLRAATINPISVDGAINQAALPGMCGHCRINLWTKAGAVWKADVFFWWCAEMWFTIGPTVGAAPVGGDGALLNQHNIDRSKAEIAKYFGFGSNCQGFRPCSEHSECGH